MALRIYVNGLTTWRDEILDALEKQTARLGIRKTPAVFEQDDPALPERAVVLYLSDGSRSPTDAEEAGLRAHLAAGRSVIPVLDDLHDAPKKLPEPLHDFNAYPVGQGPERRYGPLIDEIVTRLWLRRTARKVFLSYKRSESSAVAYQLRDKLGRRGYHVFLDECSLAVGAAVQREIFWWLNDADLVVLLCSPRFDVSPWVRAEIAAAHATDVPVFGVVWPGRKPPAELYPDERHLLDDADFSESVPGAALAEDSLDGLLTEVEAFRAVGARRRLENLLPYVRGGLDPRFRPVDAPTFGDLLLEDPTTGNELYLRVLPFRATVDEAYDLRTDLRRTGAAPEKAYLFYPENDPADPRSRALDWALQPLRGGEKPQHYRLLLYLGDGDADLGELAP